MSLESLVPELKLQILYLPWDPLELENLFLASRSCWNIYKLHKDPIATSITLDEVSKRGISLRRLRFLSPAYIEYWSASPDSYHLPAALRQIIGHDARRALILSPEERAALKGLGAIRGKLSPHLCSAMITPSSDLLVYRSILGGLTVNGGYTLKGF